MHKKLLYVITKSNWGGAQKYVYDLATHLKNDFEVSVACGGDGMLVERLTATDITTHRVRGFQRNVNIFKEILALKELYTLFKSEKPDVIHLNSTKAGFFGALIGRIARVPHIVFTAHGWPFLEPRNIIWKGLMWIVSYATSLLCHKVIVLNTDDHNTAKHMPGFLSKYVLIHTAIAPPPFKSREEVRNVLFSKKQREEHKNSFWLLTNGELNYNKNYFTAIDAVIAYNKNASQKIFYSIMSDGVLREKLREYVTKHNADTYITFLGFITDGATYYKAFDGFLLPSKKEGLPYVLLEAGHAEIPAIGSDIPGIQDVIKDKETGLLIDPYNAASIAEAFGILTKEKEETKKYAAALLERVKTIFGLETMIEKTKALY